MDHGTARRLFILAAYGLLTLACGATPPAGRTPPVIDDRGTRFDAPLARAPLTPPLVVTGGFGEYRVGHFHAAFDFGTAGVVGKPVFAPLAGHVERIRGSGVGYGRSLYLRARDGRLLQFGHLDAFAEPMASYVRAAQDSSGQYEQDLWPEASRFPIRVGQRIAWTGESGAGGPHMHFEIRRGDMAYQPQRAGLTIRDERGPSIASLTLEPLDNTSYVDGSAGPVTRRFGARAETLSVIGRVRAVVGARDGTWRGVDRMVPWITRVEWGTSWVECRMDSISWATDMSEGDEVYDAGRVIGEKGLVLWASRSFRPRFIRTNLPIDVRPGDPPLALELVALDVAGHVARGTVVLRPARPGPDTTRTLVLKNPRTGDDRFEFAALPKGYLRVMYRGARAGTRGVRIGVRGISGPDGMDGGRPWKPATAGPEGWTTVLHGPWAGRLVVEGREATGRTATDEGPTFRATQTASDDRDTSHAFVWRIPQEARFDSALVIVRDAPEKGGAVLSSEAELLSGRTLGYLGPESEPLRGPAKLGLRASEGEHEAIYRHDEDGWSWVGNQREGNRYQLESRRLGWFAEFEDTLGPRIQLRAPARRVASGPYNRWGVEATIVERGSGVDARASYFVVDGKKVAAEWDPEAQVLRWRPLAPPKPGGHRYDVVAADRAGNLSVRSGTFVLD